MYAITKEEIQDLIGEKDIVGNYFQIELLAFSENFAECAMPLTDKHKNPLGIAHGGAIFSLADLCFEAACYASGRFCVNSQSSVSFLNKGIGDKLFARADLLKNGSKMVVYQITVTDREKTVVAQGQITGYCLGGVEELISKNKSMQHHE